MIHQLTETMAEIEGENLRSVTWVIVEEVKSGDWSIGLSGCWRGQPGRDRAGDQRADRLPGLLRLLDEPRSTSQLAALTGALAASSR